MTGKSFKKIPEEKTKAKKTFHHHGKENGKILSYRQLFSRVETFLWQPEEEDE